MNAGGANMMFVPRERTCILKVVAAAYKVRATTPVSFGSACVKTSSAFGDAFDSRVPLFTAVINVGRFAKRPPGVSGR